jgi:hypothetical protein
MTSSSSTRQSLLRKTPLRDARWRSLSVFRPAALPPGGHEVWITPDDGRKVTQTLQASSPRLCSRILIAATYRLLLPVIDAV